MGLGVCLGWVVAVEELLHFLQVRLGRLLAVDGALLDVVVVFAVRDVVAPLRNRVNLLREAAPVLVIDWHLFEDAPLLIEFDGALMCTVLRLSIETHCILRVVVRGQYLLLLLGDGSVVATGDFGLVDLD